VQTKYYVELFGSSAAVNGASQLEAHTPSIVSAAGRILLQLISHFRHLFPD